MTKRNSQMTCLYQEEQHPSARWRGEGSATPRGEGRSGLYDGKSSQFGWKVITAETGPLWDAETKELVFLHYCHILVTAVFSWALLSYLIHCCPFLVAAFLLWSLLSPSVSPVLCRLMLSFPYGSFLFLVFAFLTINVDYVECKWSLKFLLISEGILKCDFILRNLTMNSVSCFVSPFPISLSTCLSSCASV